MKYEYLMRYNCSFLEIMEMGDDGWSLQAVFEKSTVFFSSNTCFIFMKKVEHEIIHREDARELSNKNNNFNRELKLVNEEIIRLCKEGKDNGLFYISEDMREFLSLYRYTVSDSSINNSVIVSW